MPLFPQVPVLPSLNKYLWPLLHLSSLCSRFTFQRQEITRIVNGCSAPFSLSCTTSLHLLLRFFTQDYFGVKETWLAWCSSWVNKPAVAFNDYCHLWSLQFYIDFCVAMCNVKPSLQFIQFLWYSASSVENFHKFHQTVQIWNFTLIISCHTHDKHIIFPKYEHTFLPSIICIYASYTGLSWEFSEQSHSGDINDIFVGS